MGECGCSGSGQFYKLAAPKGGAYILKLQPPCSDCPAPAGIAIDWHSRMGAKMFAEWVEPVEMHKLGDDYAMGGMVVLDPAAVRRSIEKWLLGRKLVRDEFEAEAYAEELVEECVVPLLFEQPKAAKGTGA